MLYLSASEVCLSSTGDRPVAGGHFGARTAAAVAAVVAQKLRRHPWLSAVDSQSGLRCLRGQSLYFVEAWKKAENLMSSLESSFITINESKGRYVHDKVLYRSTLTLSYLTSVLQLHCIQCWYKESFPAHTGPLGGANLHFYSPQPRISQYQIIHICEQLVPSRYTALEQPRLKPANSQQQFWHPTQYDTASHPANTTLLTW